MDTINLSNGKKINNVVFINTDKDTYNRLYFIVSTINHADYKIYPEEIKTIKSAIE